MGLNPDGPSLTAPISQVERPPSYSELLLNFRRSGNVKTRFEVDPTHMLSTFRDFQSMYLDDDGWLVPNSEVWQGGTLILGVNKYGCKGPDIQLGRPVIGFFGDSATMGVSGFQGVLNVDDWPHHVRVPGYEVLNAAIEGSVMPRVAAQYERLRTLVPLSCAVVYAGWHNIAYNRTDEEFWEEQLSRCLSSEHPTAFCTISTPVTEEFRTRGVEELLNHEPGSLLHEDFFIFWGNAEPTLEVIGRLLDGVARYNAFIADFCARTDAHLIDLHSFLLPKKYEDATIDFFDVCHPRPTAYEKIGVFVAEKLRTFLPGLPGEAPSALPLEALATEVAPAPEEDMRKNLYPLW